MNRAIIAGAVAAALVLILVAFNSLFIVDQTAQALVIQFGQPIREIRTPGLHAKWFFQNAVFYDRRLLDLEPAAELVTLKDQNKLSIDAYARYRIVDPLRFYQAAGVEARFELNLGSIISSTLNSVLGQQPLEALLSQDRDKVISEVSRTVSEQAKPFGVEIVDVRIRRADLPDGNTQAIYARLRSERQREASEYRAEGAEQAQGIRARAERDRTVILAEATKQSQILRGQGDAESIKIYADAYGKDVDFFTLYRSLEAYRTALGPDTTFVLSPTSEFFQYFGQHKAAKAAGP